MHVVFIISVAHGHRSRLGVISLERRLYIGNRHTCHTHLLLVGDNAQVLSGDAGYISHRDLRQLLYASAHDIVGEIAHLEKLRLIRISVRLVVAQRQVEVEHRNVGSTRFDSLGAFCVLRQGVHRRVDLLVDFDESEISVHSVVELKIYDSHSVARAAVDLVQTAHLQQLAAHRRRDIVLKFARAAVVACDLHCYVRNGYSRQQRYRESEICHQSHYQARQECHYDGYRPLEKKMYHGSRSVNVKVLQNPDNVLFFLFILSPPRQSSGLHHPCLSHVPFRRQI